MGYDRYNAFRTSGNVFIPPHVKIQPKSTDFFEEYHRGVTRLDLVSYDYYGDPGYDWLILLANPDLGNLEFEIPDGSLVRIPYPLNITLEGSNQEIEKFYTLYGIEK